MARIIEDSERAFDAVTLLIDEQRDIDRQIYDALAVRIRLDGLTLTVGSFGDSLRFPRQHVRRAELTDGYVGVVAEVSSENFQSDRQRYIDHIADRIIVMFARERYLIKR